jgi:hypothetical protein
MAERTGLEFACAGWGISNLLISQERVVPRAPPFTATNRCHQHPPIQQLGRPPMPLLQIRLTGLTGCYHPLPGGVSDDRSDLVLFCSSLP